MAALANGADPATQPNPQHGKFGGHSHGLAAGNLTSPDAADELLDIIPAPVASSEGDDDGGSQEEGYAYGGGGGGGFPAGMPGGCRPSTSSSSSRSGPTVGCPGVLANIHMRLLDFLAWDRTRGLRCGREGKQEAYWRSLLPAVNRVGGPVIGSVGGIAAGSGGGGGGAGGANGEAASPGDEEEFGGAPETTLPGLRDSKELIQASPHGFPELLRLVAIRREGVLRRVETRRMAAARGFAGLGFRREGPRGRDLRVLQARVLDPLGETMRILRHVIKSEEAKPFVSAALDEDVEPEAETDGSTGGMSDERFGANGDVEGGGEGDGDRDGAAKNDKARKRPLDLETILRRAENGWYDLEPGAEVGERKRIPIGIDHVVVVDSLVAAAAAAAAAGACGSRCCRSSNRCHRRLRPLRVVKGRVVRCFHRRPGLYELACVLSVGGCVLPCNRLMVDPPFPLVFFCSSLSVRFVAFHSVSASGGV